MVRIIKRSVILALVACILLTLASCKKTDADDKEKSDKSATTTAISTDDTTSEDKSETTEIDDSTTESTEDMTTEDATPEDDPQPVKPYSLMNPNTVLLDSNGVKLTALDFDEQSNENYITIDLRVENNNPHDVYVMINSLTVNGYLISGKFDDLITEAGCNEITHLSIVKRDIEFAEIDEIREILVSFYVKDNNFDLFVSPGETISLKTTAFDTPAKELDTSGVQVYNENGILVVVKEELDSDSRYMLAKLLIKNSSDSDTSVSCTKLLVNGKEITYPNCIRYGRVSSGLISYTSMDIEKSELEALGIEEIETIEATFKVISGYYLLAENLTVTVNYK